MHTINPCSSAFTLTQRIARDLIYRIAFFPFDWESRTCGERIQVSFVRLVLNGIGSSRNDIGGAILLHLALSIPIT